MIIIGLLSVILSGCSGEAQTSSAEPEHNERHLPATDVDMSQAVTAITMKPAEIYGDADGASIKLYLYADRAVTRDQRAHTAMSEALRVVKAGLHDALVWLYSGPSMDDAEFVAVAIYDPNRVGGDPWDVMAAGDDGDRAPYYDR
jgi:hypothetical protein